MTEQERFERLVSSEPFCYSCERAGNDYFCAQTLAAWAIWKAGRADAYQEAQEYYMTSWAKDETRGEK